MTYIKVYSAWIHFLGPACTYSNPCYSNFQELFRDKLKNTSEDINIGPLTLPMGKEILKPVAKLETGPDGVRYLEMGNRGLMLNVITPLQKFSKGGATISDVLKQRFQDIFQREMSSELLSKTEDVFTKKKEVSEIRDVCSILERSMVKWS